jgi:D-tyrosyl-tRNA(Tyr) deacylase
MIALIQLVTHAQVVVEKQKIGEISRGILALIGIERTDTEAQAIKLFERIMGYRIFPDADGKTNLSLQTIAGGLLLVPQFTLIAETSKGTRPGFSKGMPHEEGKTLFSFLVQHAKGAYPHVTCGQFGAHMQVTLCNDGPMTFILHS